MALPIMMRFTGRREIGRVLRLGRRHRTALGTVALDPAPRGSGRALFVVSTRVSKRSSERNRIKRCLEAWLADHRDSVRGVNVVVLVSPALAAAPRRALWDAAAEAFTAGERLHR